MQIKDLKIFSLVPEKKILPVFYVYSAQWIKIIHISFIKLSLFELSGKKERDWGKKK